jgi:formylglycine-generating enzyme required for sulfatase activity
VASGEHIAGLDTRINEQAVERYYDNGGGERQRAMVPSEVRGSQRRAVLHSLLYNALCLMFVLELCHGLAPARAQGAADTSSGKRVALLIGNAIYLDGNLPVSTALHDVRNLATELRRSNFDLDLMENLTRAEMRRVLDAFFAKIQPGSAALFYFSGFGLQIVNQSFLIPVDAQIRSETEAKRDGFALDNILSRMAQKAARVKVVIIDASRRNPYESRFRSFSAGLGRIDVPDGTLAIYATAPGKVKDDDSGATSLFMQQLLTEIRDPNNTAEEAFSRTRLAVSAASANEQIPWVVSSLNEDFNFAKTKGMPRLAPAQPPPVALSPLPQPARPPAAAPTRPSSWTENGAATVPSGVADQPRRVPEGSAASLMSTNIFRDCPECPEMVVIPAGSFDMGGAGRPFDRPVHRVTIGQQFAFSRYEITFENWDLCVEAGGCRFKPDDHGWGRGDHPVINVSWFDAKEYVAWLSQRTGKAYRLPSEAEWEYAARGGTHSPFYWGAQVGTRQANCSDCQTGAGVKPLSVGSFSANAFGLYDMSGNVAEWVEDCWNESYNGAPQDGSAWAKGNCSLRVLRGGSFDSPSSYLFSAARFRYDADVRYFANGLRVARIFP